MVQIEFYNITDDYRKVYKLLENPTILSGLFFTPFDVENPHVKIRVNHNVNMTLFNYCYIPTTKRYYYITNVVENNSVIELSLKVDVLMSFRNSIFASDGLIISRENANKFISNRENIYNVIPQFRRYDFSVENPFNADGNIIMITLKGK